MCHNGRNWFVAVEKQSISSKMPVCADSERFLPLGPFTMRFERSRTRTGGFPGGYSAVELTVVVAVIGVLMAASAPFFLSYLRTSALRGGAEEMASALNRARQIAIRDNTSMCVTNDGT